MSDTFYPKRPDPGRSTFYPDDDDGGGTRILSAFEKMFSRLSESSKSTVARRAPASTGRNVFERAASGLAPGVRPTSLESGIRAGARTAGNAAIGMFDAGLAVGADVGYAQDHPFIGGYKGPDAFNPYTEAGYNPFPGYRANDQFAILRKMNAETLSRLQDRLVRTGFADPDSVVPGQLNDELVGAFETVLTIANREGKAWDLVLFDTERAIADGLYDPMESRGGQDRAPFTAPAYLAPDYATLAQGVKDQMRQALGRDPDDSEIAQLTAELDGWYRAEYDEEVEAARREYEMSEEGGVPEPGRSIDPAARFKEMFESRYAPGIKNEKMKEEVADQQDLVQGTVSTLSQMSGGRG